ncbi:hypothetical protein [Geobacillus sp. BMUD]|uniref:hypothetical protein n=1 Tax=Geobacillus sp. BMUD TaxID=2508876 RepID=UPI000A7C27A3|nr:hypothetical protein [Geobacillus sp. BMUD]
MFLLCGAAFAAGVIERREARERQHRVWFGGQKSREGTVLLDFGERAGVVLIPWLKKKERPLLEGVSLVVKSRSRT